MSEYEEKVMDLARRLDERDERLVRAMAAMWFTPRGTRMRKPEEHKCVNYCFCGLVVPETDAEYEERLAKAGLKALRGGGE